MPRVLRTPAAEADLTDIAYYIAIEAGRPLSADANIDELLAKCAVYAREPLLGSAAPELGTEYRIFGFKRWIVIYRPIDDGIEVMRIVDGSRDYPTLLQN
ncbi:MAG: type II toxin-antitoxin system RelE/ParE family toxin [Planctomycetota bacterium]|nr:MAG: type II toxin-antitoxin system RelE/ParE family toxin [Planctomycetota bacterium]